MKTTLVTGGAGFIGSHVASELLHAGCKVVVIDDLSGGALENLPEGVIFKNGNILNQEIVKELFETHNFDYVFHLAAYAAEGLSHFIRNFNYTNNVVGSMNIINASVNYGVRCLVFTSSIAAYGNLPTPMREEMTPCPEDSYGIAKYSVELDLKAAHHMFGLNSIIFRPHNVFGEHQNIGDRYRNVIGIFMNQAMQKRPMTIFGDGNQKRAFSYIRDVAPIIAQSVDVPECYNEVFNIGADLPYTVNDLAAVVAMAMGVPLNVAHLPARKEVTDAFSSHDKIARIFGYKPRFSLDEGVRQMSLWAKKVGARRSRLFDNIEILKNLPVSWLEEN